MNRPRPRLGRSEEELLDRFLLDRHLVVVHFFFGFGLVRQMTGTLFR
jgi:hypothetical protein